MYLFLPKWSLYLLLLSSLCFVSSIDPQSNEDRGVSSEDHDFEGTKNHVGVPNERDAISKGVSESEPTDSEQSSRPESLGEESDSPTRRPTVDSKAEELYGFGVNALTEAESSGMIKSAFQFFREAAERGHMQARGWLALGTLLGWQSYQSFARAHSEFQQLALEGNPRGQFGLGFMYASGFKVNASVPHALVYYTFAALGGDELAEMALAYRYWTGTGVEENCESALTYYYRVAKEVAKQITRDSPSSGTTMLGPLVRRARLLEEADQGTGLLNILFGLGSSAAGSDAVIGGIAVNEDLFQYYQFMADKRNTTAQVVIGQFYFYGRHGVPKDLEKAHYYFSLAAEGGSSLAKAYLGEMYLLGYAVVKPDPVKGLAYLTQSAEDDNPIGQTALAHVYLHGRAGVAANPVKAMELLLKAAEHGWADAQLTLGRMFMGTLGMKADYKLALKYFTMASQQGNTLAFFHLAEMHATGVGVLRSCSTATELFKNVAERGRWSKWLMFAHAAYRAKRYDEAFVTYQLLAELGFEVAQSNVAYMLEEGKISIVPQSEFPTRAFVQWQRSASQGSTTSRVKLGDCYYYGTGTPVDYAKAVQHYRLASEMHQNSQAMFNLAYMHEQGLGLKRDIHLAKRYYDMAAESSLDAKIPVQLALLKLSVAFGSEYFHELSVVKYITQMLRGSSAAGSSDSIPASLTTMDWDYYAIPLLAGILLALIIYLWNARRY